MLLKLFHSTCIIKVLKDAALYYDAADSLLHKVNCLVQSIVPILFALRLSFVYLCSLDDWHEKVIGNPFGIFGEAQPYVVAISISIYGLAGVVRCKYLTLPKVLLEKVHYTLDGSNGNYGQQFKDKLNSGRKALALLSHWAAVVSTVAVSVGFGLALAARTTKNLLLLIPAMSLIIAATVGVNTAMWGTAYFYYLHNYYTWLQFSVITRRIKELIHYKAASWRIRNHRLQRLLCETTTAFRQIDNHNEVIKFVLGSCLLACSLVCVFLLYVIVMLHLKLEFRLFYGYLLVMSFIFGLSLVFLVPIIFQGVVSFTKLDFF